MRTGQAGDRREGKGSLWKVHYGTKSFQSCGQTEGGGIILIETERPHLVDTFCFPCSSENGPAD